VSHREYFINAAVWAIVAILLAWGVSEGALSRLDAALAAAVVAWPFALFYCRRVSGPVGLLVKLYAGVPPAVLAAKYFRLF